jgi:putative methyltransferase (TIGR01177 family)
VKLLIALTGLHDSMPSSEVIGCAPCIPLLRAGRIMVVETAFPDAFSRLSYAAAVHEFLGESTLAQLPFDPVETVRGSHRVTVRSGAPGVDVHAVEARLQDLVWRSLPTPRVDIQRADVALHAYVLPEGRVVWGAGEHRIRGSQFQARANQHLPFFRSYATPPRKSRSLVNMAGVQPGDRMIDPCCGTGAYLVEAALVGVAAYGSDRDPHAVAGARRNLAALGLHGEVRELDAARLAEWRITFDGLVTDLPYGHSASLFGASAVELSAGVLRSAALVLPRGRVAVVMAPAGLVRPPGDLFLTLERHLEHVHSSLTREISVLVRR